MNKQIREIEITDMAIRKYVDGDKVYMLNNELELLIQSLGYQKIDKDSVVLTERELLDNCEINYNKGYEKGSKEMAREILNKIYEMRKLRKDGILTMDDLTELARENGVEIKE